MPSRFGPLSPLFPDHRLYRECAGSIAHHGAAGQTRRLAGKRNCEADVISRRVSSMLRYRHGRPRGRSRCAGRRRPPRGAARLTLGRMVDGLEIGCERPRRARIARIMLLQKKIQREGEAPLGKSAGAVMTRRAAVGEQPCRRFALIQIFGPRSRLRDKSQDANEEQRAHHVAKKVPRGQSHPVTIRFCSAMHSARPQDSRTAPDANSKPRTSVRNIASSTRPNSLIRARCRRGRRAGRPGNITPSPP
jgi:hypothetical protein